jgi:hypothetical protein
MQTSCSTKLNPQYGYNNTLATESFLYELIQVHMMNTI